MAKGDDTRQRIIEQAAPLFNQSGYEGTALSDLMQRTGLQKGGIYRHFSSKEELAAEAFEYAWQVASRARLRDVDEPDHAVDKLKRFVTNFVDRRGEAVPGGCPLLNTAIDSDDGNPVLRKHARQALNGWLDRLQTILKEGKQRYQIKAEADPRSLATFIVSSLEGSLMVARLLKSDEPMRQARAQLEALLESVRAQ
jgi:TetR/AcrR family transcriptional repressor of nem operon